MGDADNGIVIGGGSERDSLAESIGVYIQAASTGNGIGAA